MSSILNQSTIFQIPSQPFQNLVPSGWLQNQEYEQLLEYLGQLFNDFHENINAILDFFDSNKCPESFIKRVAFNLGMEIPLDSDLVPEARALIKNAIIIYKTKGTFNALNTAEKGIGLWIKMATGYNITVNSYPLLNPYMFVSQFNYRCTKLRDDGGSEPSYVAVHPYEKEADGTARIMYKHELNKYASEPENTFNIFGVGDSSEGQSFYLFDYETREDIHGSDIPGIRYPATPVFSKSPVSFMFNNRLHLLFGKDESNNPIAKMAAFDFPVCWDKTAAIQLDRGWTITDATLPDGITSIQLNKTYQTFVFRNYVYFVGIVDGSASPVFLCRFNVLTRATEILNIGKTLTGTTVTAFNETKFFFIITEDAVDYLYVYDFITEDVSKLSTIPVDRIGSTYHSMACLGAYLFIALPNNEVSRYDIYYDTYTTFSLEITSFDDPAYLVINSNQLCVQKFLVDGSFTTCGLYTIDSSSVIEAEEGDSLAMDSDPRTYMVADANFTNVFYAFVTSGNVVYPSTFIINIESYGEFNTARSLYARKMQTVKNYLERYIQAGVLALINDDN